MRGFSSSSFLRDVSLETKRVFAIEFIVALKLFKTEVPGISTQDPRGALSGTAEVR